MSSVTSTSAVAACSREPEGVVEENLVSSGLDDQGGKPDSSAYIGLMRPSDGSCPDV